MKKFLITCLFLICTFSVINQVNAYYSIPPIPGPKGDTGDPGKNGDNQSNNAFDYGLYLNGILYETPNTEWGVLGTWLNESNETRVYLGGKVYFNRMTYQRK